MKRTLASRCVQRIQGRPVRHLGHASEREWNIGYAYTNGKFQCMEGKIFGLDTKGNRYFVDSPNPKVYMPIGNCLMGHIDGPDCMANLTDGLWCQP
jgi:hypothetical protein